MSRARSHLLDVTLTIKPNLTGKSCRLVLSQVFVYFENIGIIFQSSFLHIPFDNTIAKIVPGFSRVIIDLIREEDLNVSRVVGKFRNNNISVEVMNKTYDAMM